MRRWVIVLLTLATALVHVSFFLPDPKAGIIFGLNALGYIGLLGLLYLKLGLPAPVARVVRPAFIGYTALTIVLYVVFSYRSGHWSVPLGPIDKLIEMALVALLWSERQPTAAG